MYRFLIVASLLSAAPAWAQSTSSPVEQALGARLLREIQEGLTCSAEKIAMQAAIDKAAAEAKRLKDKYEPEGKQ